ncbi:MAG TPA: 50S ribosomal protein L18 [Candidatus Pacearchaeota archaeon]|nr:50S ribosomal protein L18 [Candidatus Pacearchaeota archaeon]
MQRIFQRRKKGRTDYLKRKRLLSGKLPRLVFRRTNQYIFAQYVVSHEAQDKVEITLSSKHLLKYGWPKELEGSLKSIPACYLTGRLIGKKMLKEKKQTPVVDFGIAAPTKKSRAYAFLKGVVDAGVKLSVPKEVFPEEERVKGKNLKKDFSATFEKIKSSIDKE